GRGSAPRDRGSGSRRTLPGASLSAGARAINPLTEECACDVVPLERHRFQLRRRLLQRAGDHLVAAQRRHLAEVACLDEVRRLQAEPRREDPVAGGGRAAALDVPEDGDARLEPGPARDLVAEALAYAALREQLVPELVDLALVLG